MPIVSLIRIKEVNFYTDGIITNLRRKCIKKVGVVNKVTFANKSKITVKEKVGAYNGFGTNKYLEVQRQSEKKQ